MRIKVFLLAIICSFGVFDAYAQKGVDNGTQYGSGEDSIRCVTNISLFVPYAKANNFKDAYEFWKIVYDECPAATKDIYLYGVRIVSWQIANESDPAKKEALVDDLMAVYDKRIQYFGNDTRYGKDWIMGNKAQDYIQHKGANADNALLYSWLKEVVDEYGDKTNAMALSYYMYASFQVMSKDENHKAMYVNDYLRSIEILDKQLAAANAANNEKEAQTVTSFRAAVEATFINSGAADCETLQNIYAPKIEENKGDLDFLKETIALLRRMRCVEIDAYFAASEYAHQINPTSESSMGMARSALKKGDMNGAIEYFEQAASLEDDPATKAENYYLIAMLFSDQKQYAKAKQYCLKAIEFKPNYGAPYILIAQMYAATASQVYPNDAVMRKTVFYAVVDKLERARSVDPEVASEANSLIRTYSAYFPSAEEIFMHPDIEKGKSITVPGWINERTTIR